MKAVVWQGPEHIEIGECPEPGDPRPDEVVMSPEAVGICGSEIEGGAGIAGCDARARRTSARGAR